MYDDYTLYQFMAEFEKYGDAIPPLDLLNAYYQYLLYEDIDFITIANHLHIHGAMIKAYDGDDQNTLEELIERVVKEKMKRIAA